LDYSEGRTEIVNWLRQQMIGPASDSNILRNISPLARYPTGVLFPIARGEEGIDPASLSDDDDDYENLSGSDEIPHEIEPTTKRRRYTPPSSVGFSFYVTGEVLRFQVICSAAKYSRPDNRDDSGQFIHTDYERVSLGGDAEALTFEAHNKNSHRRFNERQDILGGAAGVDVLWRQFGEGWIVTVSLFNQQELDVFNENAGLFSQERNELSLFEVNLKCFLEAGEIASYPRTDRSLLTDEEQELDLQYARRHIYAVGHGAAVDWVIDDGEVRELFTQFMPVVEVPQVTADVAEGDSGVLELSYLAATNNKSEIFQELEDFVAGYGNWVVEQGQITEKLGDHERKVAGHICGRMEKVLFRMKRGVSLLRADSLVAESFRLANQAMLEQMMQTDRIRNKLRDANTYKWRPFQLAFLLTVLEATVKEDNEFRDTVDLIWFPTGGGKTEAYLGLISFLIVWRRLTFSSSGGGTSVIMRYTLRLLTAQQYLRATRIICALELMRRRTKSLGHEPITVGMWVGEAMSPNTYSSAQKFVRQASDGRAAAQQRMVLTACPWCETPFVAPENYKSTQDEFGFCCTNSDCDFGSLNYLPCNVVDEALYEHPPTLLLATVDKFARLAWDDRANSFFAGRPPELVIQDELHLIAGALGSVTGLYEAALDTVLISRKIYPKYIASTATIRMATQQVERLYGRELAVFPPPGISCDDSYFARTVPLSTRPGRLYVGYLAPMLDRRHCLAPLAAAVHVAPEAVFHEGRENRDELLEAWWTQVVYHGSLKDVGNSHNAFNIDIREIVQRFSNEFKQMDVDGGATNNGLITRPSARISQLTSISSAEENSKTFSRLEQSRKQPDCLDAVLATNMVSVGLDVSRLALMVINGQPLTTAEYIQSSSRVGRSEVPGIVLTNYFRDQARSLSHYENFRPYHESFYRFVEPTSVTPYTHQCRGRALHAALVIAIRHSYDYLLGNDQADNFDLTDERLLQIIETFKKRCAKADKDRAKETSKHIDRIVEQWAAEVKRCEIEKIQLRYHGRDDDKVPSRLLYNHDAKIRGLWPTLQSMRNVEDTALLASL
jgi:hypothetical protein